MTIALALAARREKWRASSSQSFYASFMEENAVYIELTLDLRDPVDLFQITGSLASFGHQFNRYLRKSHPEFSSSARIYLKEVRSGSFVFELLPLLMPIIQSMDAVIIVRTFLETYYNNLSAYFTVGGRARDVKSTDLKDFMNAVESVATDPNGRSSLTLVEAKKTSRTEYYHAEFTTSEARQARTEIEKHQRELEQRGEAEYEQVVMTFEQTNTKDPSLGRNSQERGVIESIDSAARRVVYASPLAGQRIKAEIVSGHRNIYKLGFVVDVNVETAHSKPVAYRIVNVHDVIDLSEGE